jgi:hypothetical protein
VEKDPQDLKQYGLAVPQMIIEVGAITRDTPLKLKFGFERDDGSYYCQTSESPQVVAVGGMLLGDLPEELGDIRGTADSQ